MVFFTCNHCGESVKKPSVEKHYNTRCRNSGIFVSCMDCQKDFRDDYVGHTKCITEAEKYSGKDYVPKESKNRGQKKQDSWLEIVRSVLTTKEYEVSPAVRVIFQKLQSYDNVPRKKAKFENFVSNSMRVRKDQAAAVWNVLEKALDQLKAAREAEKNSDEEKNGDAKNNEHVEQNGANEETADVSIKQEVNLSKKRKKDRKQQEEEQNDTVASVEENQEEPPKEKRKKKNKEAPTKIEADSTIKEHTAESNPKLDSKTDQTEKNGAIGATTDVSIQQDEKLKKKRKKDKKKPEEEQNGTSASAGENQEDSPKEKKKKKNKEALTENGAESTIEECTVDSNPKLDCKTTNGGSPVNGIKQKALEFDWDTTIFKILGKHNDEIALEDLRSKVLKKYKKKYQLDEISYKVEKTFSKKMKKSGLLIENDVVKINVK